MQVRIKQAPGWQCSPVQARYTKLLKAELTQAMEGQLMYMYEVVGGVGVWARLHCY